MRKPEKDFYSGSDEQKRSRKLKPVKKEKNLKQALYDEIDELQDIELDYRDYEFSEDDLIDDDEY